MRSLRVLIAAIVMVALCSVGSTAAADETDTPPDSTSAQTPETPAPEPTPETPAPTENPTPTPEPTKGAPSPDPEPTADPTPKNDSAIVPSAPKSSKKTAALTVADAFAVDDEYTIVENSVNTLLDPSVTTNDTGIQPGSGFIHSGASHGLVVNTSGGFAAVYTYAPFTDFVGDDSFTYTFTGTDGLDHTATVTIHVTSEAGTPHAVDDEYTVVQDSGTTLLNPDVTANDVGIPGVTLYTNSPADHGTVTNSNPLNGHVYSYQPDSGFYGDDTFSYAFLDAEGHPHNATVTIHVTPLPGDAVDDEYTVMQDSGLTVLNPDVTANDTGIGPFGQFSHTAASHGFVSNAGPFGGGHDWAYSTSPGFFGDDTFEYTFIGNDGLPHTATVTIHVTPTPGGAQAVDDTYTVAQDSGTTLLTPPVTLNDGFAMPLTFTNTSATHGSVTSTPLSSNYSYTPAAGFHGDDTFTYTFLGTDGLLHTGTVTIHVTPSGPTPGAVDDVYTVAQDSGTTLLDPAVTANDGAALALTYTNTPAGHGTVTSTPGSPDYSYTPNAGYSGDDTFTYTYVDPTPQLRTATVTIHVTPAASVTASPDVNTITEDSAPNPVSGNVLTNDTTTVGTLSVTSTGTFTLDHGTLVMNADGTYTFTLHNSNPAVDALNDGQTLTDTFTYGASNGQGGTDSAKLTITIHGHTDLIPVEFTVSGSQTFGGVPSFSYWSSVPGVTATDVVCTTANPGTITISAALPVGSYTLSGCTGTVSDAGYAPTFTGGSFDVDPDPGTIIATGDSGDITEDSAPNPVSGNVLTNDTTTVGTLSVTSTGTFTLDHGTLVMNADGTYAFTLHNSNPAVDALNDGQTLTDTFTYGASNGQGGTDSAKLTITIHGHTDVVPSATDDEYTVAQDSGATVLSPDVTVNDTGINAIPVFSNSGAAHGTVTHSSFGHDYAYAPDAGYSGDDTFTYSFTGTDLVSHTATVTIHVTPTRATPVPVDDEYTVSGDQPTVLDPPVTANDIGVPAGGTSPIIVNGPRHGSVTIDASGDITFTPDEGFVGTDTFSYRLGTPPVPTVNRAAVAAIESATVTLTVASAATDPDDSTDPGDSGDPDAQPDSDATLPDTGSPIGSTELVLALLLVLGGGLTVGIAQHLPRRRRPSL